jgi:hypothetical protein
MKRQPLASRISLGACLAALIERRENITALTCGAFLSTRTSNIICELRNRYGIKIRSLRVTGRSYYRYALLETPANVKKARSVLSSLKRDGKKRGEGVSPAPLMYLT